MNRFGNRENPDFHEAEELDFEYGIDSVLSPSDVNRHWSPKYRDICCLYESDTIYRSSKKTGNLYYGPNKFLNRDSLFDESD